MRKFTLKSFKVIKKQLLAISVGLALASCGGGGGSSSKGDSSNPSGSDFTGRALKGPVQDGKVVCYDKDGNVVDFTTTNTDGNFKLKKTCPAGGKLVLRGGIDKSTGLPVEEMVSLPGSKFITPLSTMQYIYKDKQYNLRVKESGSENLLQQSGNIDPTQSGSKESREMTKANLVLDSVVKIIQRSSDSEITYFDGMKFVLNELKDKDIAALGKDAPAEQTKAKTIIDDLFKKFGFNDQTKDVNNLIEKTSNDLQKKDSEKGGLKGEIPQQLTVPFRYVSVVKETFDGSSYKVTFDKSSASAGDEYEYKCKIFEKKAGKRIGYRKKAEWDSAGAGAFGCKKSAPITIAKKEEGKYLVIRYSLKDAATSKAYGYSQPYQIGSIHMGKDSKIEFSEKVSRVYLPIAGVYEDEIINALGNDVIPNLKTNSKALGYLPVGFYYKPTKVALSKFDNVSFGVKLEIGDKEIVMMMDRLFVKRRAMEASTAENPYLHGVLGNTETVTGRSTYSYAVGSIWNSRLVAGDTSYRNDYNTKNGFLRFKAPVTTGGDNLNVANQDKLSGNLIGVSLYDMCNQKLANFSTRATATVCDYIRSTINAEEATAVTITPFVKSESVNKNSYKLTTNQKSINLNGITGLYTFPPVKIKGKPNAVKEIDGEIGLKGIDSDGDGVSDYDEMNLGRNPFKAESADTDTDGDGLSDITEIKLGMDATTKDFEFKVSQDVVDIKQDGTPKDVTITLRASATVKTEVELEFEKNAGGVVELDVGIGVLPIDKTKVIKITPKKIFALNIKNPAILVKAVLINGSNKVQVGVKKIKLTSKDFSYLLKPTSVAFNYKNSSGSPSNPLITGTKLRVGGEIEASPSAPSDFNSSYEVKYQWQHSSNGNDYIDISDAKSAIYKITTTDAGKFIGVKIAYLKKVNPAYTISQAPRKDVPSTVNKIAVNPMAPAKKPTLTSDATNVYPISTVTMTTTAKAGMEIVRRWKFDGTYKASGGKFESTKELLVPSDTKIGTKISGCYAYKVNGATSDFTCSDEVTVKKDPGIIERIKSVSIQNGAGKKLDKVSALLNDKGYLFVPDKVYILVELPFAIKKLSESAAKLVISNGTDELVAKTTVSKQAAINAFAGDNKSKLVFMLNLLGKEDSFVGKKYSLKSFSARVTKADGSSKVKLSHSEASKPVYQKFDIVYKGLDSTVVPVIKKGDTDSLFNNKKATVGDVLRGEFKIASSATAIERFYKWEKTNYLQRPKNPSSAKLDCDKDGWTEIATSASDKHTVDLGDDYSCIRVSVSTKKDGKPTGELSYNKGGSDGTVRIDTAIATTPTIKPADSSETEFYINKPVVATGLADKNGYNKIYVWQAKTSTKWEDIAGETSTTYTPSGEYNVDKQKLRFCYRYENDKFYSATVCSAEIALRLPEAKISSNNVQWGTDITFDTTNDKEYRLVKTDGSANDATSTGIRLNILNNKGTISATKSGSVKLQNRIKPAGDWTTGVKVTFVVQPSPATISAPTQVVYEGIPFDLSTLISSNTEPQSVSFVKSSGDNIANFDYKPTLVALGGSHGKSAVYTITFAKSHKYDTKSVNVTIKAMRIYKPSLAVLSGTPVTGETLSLKVATPPAGYSVHYVWQKSPSKSIWTDITGATGSKPSYTLDNKDAKHYIRVKAQYVRKGMTDSFATIVEEKERIKQGEPKGEIKVTATTETWGTDIKVTKVSGQEYRIRGADGSSSAPNHITYDKNTGVISASKSGIVKLQTRYKYSGVESAWTAGITITFTIKPSPAILVASATTVKEGGTFDLSSLISNAGQQSISYAEASDTNNIGSLSGSIVAVASGSHGKSATYTITFAKDNKYALKEFVVTITAEKHDGVKRLSLSGNRAVGSTLTAVVVGATPTGFTTVYKWERSTASGYETIGSNSPKYKLVDKDKDKFIKLSVWHENSGMTNTDVVSVTTASRIKPKMPNDEAKTVGGIYRTEYGNDITVVTVSGQEYEIFDRHGVSAPFDKVKFDKTTGVISATGFGVIKLRTRVKATAGIANALPSDWTAGVVIEFIPKGASLVNITGDSTVGETLTMNADPASPGYTINYEWYRVADAYDKNSWVPITGQSGKTYTLTNDDLDKYIGGKVWYTKTGYTSSKRSSTTTVKVRPAKRATETKTDKDTAQWGTDITFTSLNTDEYRLVATDGTPNKPSSTGISLNVSGNKGTISATKSGMVKLQTRVKASGAADTRPSAWTAGATVTFMVQQSPATLSSTLEMVTEEQTFDLSTLVSANTGLQAISYAEASDPNNIGSLNGSIVTVIGLSNGKSATYAIIFAKNAKYATKIIEVKITAVEPTGPESAVITGDMTVGKTISVTVATIAGFDNKYQWQRIDNSGSRIDITGANNSTYKLQRSDVNKFIGIKVWYAKSGVTDSGAGIWTQLVSVRPAIPSIEATTVNALSEAGVGTDITVATVSGQEYRILAADGESVAPNHITYDKTTGVISATNKGTIVLQTRVASDTTVLGSRPSEWTAGVAITFIMNGPNSVVVSGLATVGKLLTVTASDVTGYDLNYQWQRSESTNGNWTDISGANSMTYTVKAIDENKYIRVKVWYVSSDGTEKSAAKFGKQSLIINPAVPSEAVASAYTAVWGMDITVATVPNQDYRLVGTDGATKSVPSGITLTNGVIEASQSGSVKLQTRVASDKNVQGSRPSDWTAGVAITFTVQKSLGKLSATTATVTEGQTFDLSKLVSANPGSQAISYAEASDPSGIGSLSGSVVTIGKGPDKSATYTITFAKDDKYALKEFMVTITAKKNDGAKRLELLGNTEVGETLTAIVVGATPSGFTVVYEWKRSTASGWETIGSNNYPKYKLIGKDRDKFIKLSVWHEKSGLTNTDTVSAKTISRIKPAMPNNEATTVNGTSEAEWGTDITVATVSGQEYRIFASDGLSPPPSGIQYDSNTGVISATKFGSVKLRTRVKATTGVSGALSSDWTDGIVIKFIPKGGKSVKITGDVTVGETLTATVANVPAGAIVKYQWGRITDAYDASSWIDITSGTASNYRLANSDLDNYIGIKVWYVKTGKAPYGEKTTTTTVKVRPAKRQLETKTDKYIAQWGTDITFTSSNSDEYRLVAIDGVPNEASSTGINLNVSGNKGTISATKSGTVKLQTRVKASVGTDTRPSAWTAGATVTFTIQQSPATLSSATVMVAESRTFDLSTLISTATGQVISYAEASDTNNIGSLSGSFVTVASGSYGKSATYTLTLAESAKYATKTLTVTITSVPIDGPPSVVVLGDMTVGETLSVDVATMAGFDNKYQWQHVNDSGIYNPITGANNSTYKLQVTDVNKLIGVKVWYAKSGMTDSTITGGKHKLKVRPAVPSEATTVNAVSATDVGMVTVATVSGQEYRLVGTDGVAKSVPNHITMTNGVIKATKPGSVKLQTRVASDTNVSGSRPSDWTAGTTITFTIKSPDSVVLSGVATVGKLLTATASATAGYNLNYQWQHSDSINSSWTDISGANSTTYTLQASDIDKYVGIKVWNVSADGREQSVAKFDKHALRVNPAVPSIEATTVGAVSEASTGMPITVATVSGQEYRLVGTDGMAKSVPSNITLTAGVIEGYEGGIVLLQTRVSADTNVAGSRPSDWTAGATITFIFDKTIKIKAKVKFALKTTEAPNTTDTGGGNYKTYLVKDVDYANPYNQPVTMTSDSASVTIVKRDNRPWNYLDGLSDANRPDVVYTFNTTSGGKPVKSVPLLIYIRKGVKADVKVNFAEIANYKAQSIAATLENRFALPSSFADIASSVNPEWVIDLSKLFTIPNSRTQTIEYVEATKSNNVATLNGSVVTIAKSSVISKGDFVYYKVKFVENNKYRGGEFNVKLTVRVPQAKPVMEAISATTVAWNMPVDVATVSSQDYRFVGVGTNVAPAGVTLTNGIIRSARFVGLVKLQTRYSETPTTLASDWTDGATITFTKANAKVRFVVTSAEAPGTTKSGGGKYKYYKVGTGVTYANPHNQPVTMTTDSSSVTIVKKGKPWNYLSNGTDVVYGSNPLLIYIHEGVTVDVKLNFAETALYNAQSIAGTLANRIDFPASLVDVATSVNPNQVIDLSKLFTVPNSRTQAINYVEASDSSNVASINGSMVTISPYSNTPEGYVVNYKVKFVQNNKYKGGEFNIKLTVRKPQQKPSSEAISPITQAWNIPINVATVSGQDYHLVSVGTDVAPTNVIFKDGVITSAYAGSVKLQTRKSETLTKLASDWTDGATITFTKINGKVKFALAAEATATTSAGGGNYKYYAVGRGVTYANPGNQPVAITTDSSTVTIVKRDYRPWDYLTGLSEASRPDVVYRSNPPLIYIRNGVSFDVKVTFVENALYNAQSIAGKLSNRFDLPASFANVATSVNPNQVIDLSKLFISSSTRTQAIEYTEVSDNNNIATLKGSVVTISSGVSFGDFATYKVKFVEDSKYKGGEFKVKLTAKSYQQKPSSEAISPITQAWNIPVNVAIVSSQDYRLVSVGTGAVPSGIKLNNGVIKATVTGSVKLQTRKSETPTKRPSDWTNGATITFVKAPSPARFALTIDEASRDKEGSAYQAFHSTYLDDGRTLYSSKYYDASDMNYSNPAGQTVTITSQEATVVKQDIKPWSHFIGQHYGWLKKVNIVYSFDARGNSRYKGSKQLIFVRRGVTANATVHFAENDLYEATSVNVKLSATKSTATPPKVQLSSGGTVEFGKWNHLFIYKFEDDRGYKLKDKEYRVVGIDGGSLPAPVTVHTIGYDQYISANAPAVGLLQVRQLASPKYEQSGWVSTRFEFTKKKQAAPSIEARTVGATAKAEWGTDITVATVSGQEYRIVGSDGATGSVPSHIKYDAKSGIISATAAGVIKLQTRIMEGTGTQPSPWTKGATITFTNKKVTSINYDIKVAKVISTHNNTYSNSFNQSVNIDSVVGTGDSVFGIVASSNNRLLRFKLDNNRDIAYSNNVTGGVSRLIY